jgi:hypothetical protein
MIRPASSAIDGFSFPGTSAKRIFRLAIDIGGIVQIVNVSKGLIALTSQEAEPRIYKVLSIYRGHLPTEMEMYACNTPSGRCCFHQKFFGPLLKPKTALLIFPSSPDTVASRAP